MKKQAILASTFVGLLAILGLGIAQDIQNPAYIGQDGTPFVSFTPPVTNSDGTPLTDLAGYTIVVTSPEGDANAGLGLVGQPHSVDLGAGVEPDPQSPGDVRFDVKKVFEGKPAGLYRVWVAAYDGHQNRSRYTPSVNNVDWDTVRPGQPANVRVHVEVIVRVITGG